MQSEHTIVAQTIMSEPIHDEERESGVGLAEEVREPKRFKVLLHNDDYTTMEFVVKVLMQVFRKTEAEAVQIMLNVHNKGIGSAGSTRGSGRTQGFPGAPDGPPEWLSP